jgi:hypothetical protein
MAYDANSGNVILFGGRSPDLTFLNDTWAFDGASWMSLSPSSSPMARQNHLLATVSQGILLFGGDSHGTALADTWLWSGTRWQPVPTLHAPVAWRPAGMASRNGQAVLLSYASTDAQPQTYVMSQNDWVAD